MKATITTAAEACSVCTWIFENIREGKWTADLSGPMRTHNGTTRFNATTVYFCYRSSSYFRLIRMLCLAGLAATPEQPFTITIKESAAG